MLKVVLVLVFGPPALIVTLLGAGTLVNMLLGMAGLNVPEGPAFLLSTLLVVLGGVLVWKRQARRPAGTFVWPLAWLWALVTGLLTVFLAAMATDSGSAQGQWDAGLVLGVGTLLAAAPLVVLALRRKARQAG